MYVLISGLLAELPAILDSLLLIRLPQVNTYIGVVGQGWWRATILAG